MRIVIDSNILISALLSPTGPPGQLAQLWMDGRFELASSKAQIEELGRVFDYPKIHSRISSEQAADFLNHIDAMATVLDGLPLVELSPDPDDNVILVTAIKAKADCIVSGDRSDLLSLKEAKGIPVITARRALARFTSP